MTAHVGSVFLARRSLPCQQVLSPAFQLITITAIARLARLGKTRGRDSEGDARAETGGEKIEGGRR